MQRLITTVFATLHWLINTHSLIPPAPLTPTHSSTHSPTHTHPHTGRNMRHGNKHKSVQLTGNRPCCRHLLSSASASFVLSSLAVISGVCVLFRPIHRSFDALHSFVRRLLFTTFFVSGFVRHCHPSVVLLGHTSIKRVCATHSVQLPFTGRPFLFSLLLSSSLLFYFGFHRCSSALSSDRL